MTIVKYNLCDKYLLEYQCNENHPYIDKTKLCKVKRYNIYMDMFFDYLCKR